jgi:hypothetical protein
VSQPADIIFDLRPTDAQLAEAIACGHGESLHAIYGDLQQIVLKTVVDDICRKIALSFRMPPGSMRAL